MFKIELEEVKEAYCRLKNHVYHDTSDLFIRRRLAEFETNLTNKDDKFEMICDALNQDGSFFEPFMNKMLIRYLPKQFKSIDLPSNYITNKRIQDKYFVERGSAFIDVPIEIHLITVLWIMKYGGKLDANLGNHAYGNRLLLNKNKDSLMKGSALFKPYYKQYQSWRDRGVNIAKDALENNEDVLFLNLDIKDYYYSVNIDLDSIYTDDKIYYPTLVTLFKDIHIRFTEQLKKNNFPFQYSDKLQANETIIPIGLLSSYILGNHFLKDFDSNVLNSIKPIYYGRYVDDILFVIKNPTTHKNLNTSSTESLIISELKDVFLIQKVEKQTDDPCEKEQSFLKFRQKKFKNLCCQPDKTLIYYFDHNESELVIDKLKRELEERASEFRDFPAEDNSISFEESAYHLLYDGSEGKIKTLKDYKENKYGLSVYLSNKIFSALRHNNKLKHEESKKVLNFFKGLNCLELFRLWEKVFTFFMVNNDPSSFVDFYIHTFSQITSIKQAFIEKSIKIGKDEIETALLDYLDCALEMTLALNPYFVSTNKAAKKKLEFFQNEKNKWFTFLLSPFSELSNESSFHIRRFRESNLIRHHYVAQPLVNYTTIAYDKKVDLTSTNLPLSFNNKPIEFDPSAIENSPRIVKFWECCLIIILKKLSDIQVHCTEEKDDFKLELFQLVKEMSEDEKKSLYFYLDEAFELYEKINKHHIADHRIDYDNIQSSFYSYHYDESNTDCDLLEFQINKDNKLKDIKISFANTEVKQDNIEASIEGIPNLDVSRYNTFQKIFQQTRQENANILLLPENSLPYQFLASLARYSCDNSIMCVSGVEHWRIENYAFNFIVTVLPVKVNNINDAVVLIRLKNHYAPGEKDLINDEHLYCPKPSTYRYDLINWRNLYFSPFYCFELADSVHRSMFRSKVDLLVASEWNKDTPYFSNIVEALSRDIHAYIAQVNTSQYGDSRLTRPSSSATKDILKLKGGINDTVLIGQINLKSLRKFQSKKGNISRKEFKPLPPDYDYRNAKKRQNNETIH